MLKSFQEQKLPLSWKLPDVVPLPKQKPVEDASKHLRLISLTPAISKLTEEFIGPAVLNVIDTNQYGGIPKSSTLLALTSMLHHWSKATDGTGAAISVILFDYRREFDFIDHNPLIQKVLDLDIPGGFSNWVIDFLCDRKQHVQTAYPSGGRSQPAYPRVPSSGPGFSYS